MANKIQIKRGTKANLPTLAIAEPGFTTDTKELFIGSAAGNIRVGGSNENLFDNWYWQNIVNQRGITAYTAAYQYGADRWMTDSTYAISVNNGLVFGSTGGRIVQRLSYEKMQPLIGRQATVTFHDGTDYHSRTFTIQNSAWVDLGPINPSVSVEYGFNDTNFFYVVFSGYSINIRAVKLELGPISTLANDPPADFGEQLALCQRYLLAINEYRIIRAGYVTTNEIYFDIPLPAPMRIYPTIVIGEMLAVLNQVGFTFFVDAMSPSHMRIVATKTAHGLTDAALILRNVLFSADL